MVERVDRSLRDDLGLADGLADECVHVLDPCCGTGSYLAEVLRRIDRTLADRGLGALKGHKVKEAAAQRVHGFEIMPAPFVVSHLQIGLLLQGLQAPLAEDGSERASVYLTNALTGWSDGAERQIEAFPEFATERELAAEVKREEPILVVIGNPPYNGYAGMAMAEEQELTRAYRTTKKVRRPEGQGLNDLYVRFFRMAERRIVEMTGRGIVCFISNYSWLDGLSFTGMRERYQEVFDAIRIDCLNGDKYKTGKLTPEGEPDPSIFSSPQNPVGIQVGTAIALLVRIDGQAKTSEVGFRDIWGRYKRQILVDTAGLATHDLYRPDQPRIELGLPFRPGAITPGYFDWPSLPDLLPTWFPGVQTKRDEFLVDIDRENLLSRINYYFDRTVTNERIRVRFPEIMHDTARYDAGSTRDFLLTRGMLSENVVPYYYRPFDVRWVYWEPETKLLGEKSPAYWPHARKPNYTLVIPKSHRKEWSEPLVCQILVDLNAMDGGASCIPHELEEVINTSMSPRRPNISRVIQQELSAINITSLQIFWHSVAVMHAPQYRRENAEAFRMNWPRLPIPASKRAFESSSQVGNRLVELLDPGVAIPIVTKPLLTVGVPTASQGNELHDLALTARWGHRTATRSGIAIMPGQGQVRLRAYRSEEREAMAEGARARGMEPADVFRLLGETTCDVQLNGNAYWANVPMNVWRYKLGGYQVIKKWLSYREKDVLGRALRFDEVLYVTEMARRIAAILLMGPELDANYRAVVADAIDWAEISAS